MKACDCLKKANQHINFFRIVIKARWITKFKIFIAYIVYVCMYI